ncbi:G protein-coupled receptor family protein [Micromonospora tarensis]|uniref:Homeodomain-like domain-containing protein n=1 Tax=Micromonospora tarensis TaxID=2806100 RepID=A0ABS1YQD5_9ACTN|nr:DMT family transporter [Micromonospora tarensis]MBM0279652.1 hypothetical protein [Micromonospora tarensis]
MKLPEWTEVADFAPTYATPILFGVGTVGALLGVLLIWRFFRTGHAHTRVGFLAVVLATAFAAEGMWEVARQTLKLPPLMALGLFGMFEVVMVSQGLLAKHKLTQTPPGDVRRHMNFVWAVAAGSGIVASSASDSVPEFLLRLCAPAVGAGIWWMGITADKPASAVQPTSWIWTPRRIGIHLRLIKPGAQDLEQVDRDRRIDAITVTAHRLHHGSPRLARFRKAKLRRLALEADDAMVAQAQQRVARVNRIEKLTSPDAPTTQPSDAERELMDELRRLTTSAEARIRADHARAFGIGGESMVELDGIRMPAHLAAQIGDMPEGWTPGIREPRRESVHESATDSADEPRSEPGSDSPRTTVATQRPTHRRVTEPVRTSAQKADDKKIAQAYTRLTKKLGREPSGEELGKAAGVSKATANRWKRDNAPTTKES